MKQLIKVKWDNLTELWIGNNFIKKINVICKKKV